jgi:type IV pilus assembly protein PilB
MAQRIGELLVKSRLINKKQLAEALAMQQQSEKRLGEILIDLGYIKLGDLVKMLSKQKAIPFVALRAQILNEKLIKSFPERLLYDHTSIPLYETEDELHIAIGDPTNETILKELKQYTDKRIVPSGAEPKKILRLLNKYFLLDQAERFLNEEP